MSDLYSKTYNPDVLNCLANLSNDEVFTPPEIANKILDMLPRELFSNKNTTFLDPACKSGVFLREIAKRLLVGLEKEIPNRQKRIDHIFHNQLYAIAITEMTSLLSRRSVYCSKYPNGKYSVSRFDDADGNIRFKKIKHTWNENKCKYCGASKEQYDRDESLESHAYEFIHADKPEDIFNMKFDVIIGNPPYQLSDGGYSASAMPIYHKFIQQAKKLQPRYLSMIIPSRWFSGGRSLDSFRDEMLNDDRIRNIIDYSDSTDCFPGVDMSGGVCYFLWSRDYKGFCDVTHIDKQGSSSVKRALNTYPIFIRSNFAIPIIDKIASNSKEYLSARVSSQRPFGFRTFARPTGTGDIILRWNGGKGNIEYKTITSGIELIDKYKVIVSRVVFEHAGRADAQGKKRILSILEILQPKEICTETYIVVDCFDSEVEAINLKNYLATKFVRFLVSQIASSQMINKVSFSFVPMQDFSEPWTDEKLYKKYKLTKEEIVFIESMIRPMEVAE